MLLSLLVSNRFEPFIYSAHRTKEPCGEHGDSIGTDEVGNEHCF